MNTPPKTKSKSTPKPSPGTPGTKFKSPKPNSPAVRGGRSGGREGDPSPRGRGSPNYRGRGGGSPFRSKPHVDDSLSDAMAKLTVKDGVPQYDPFVELTTFSNGATDTKKILLNVNLAGKHFDDDDFQGFLEFLDIKVTRLIEENPGKRVGILQFHGEDNKLGDAGIVALSTFLLKHDANLSVRVLKLYNNRIGDTGASALATYFKESAAAPIHEVHLSHNRITTVGANDLLSILSISKKYPYAKERRTVPLWLRLEHNYISTELCKNSLRKSGCSFCIVSGKVGRCSAGNCTRMGVKLHLAFFEFQYYSQVLDLAKQALAPRKKTDATVLTNAISTQSLSNLAPLPSSSLSDEAQAPLSTSTTMLQITVANSSADSANITAPLFMFFDTNAVANSLAPKDKGFTFNCMRERFMKGRFSSKDASIENRVIIVVTDTVLGELDGLCKRGICNSRIMEDHLVFGEESGYVVMLGAHQGEKLVKSGGRGVSSSDGLNMSIANDRMIIDVALMYKEEIGDGRCVCFVSDDKTARLAARNHGLAAVSYAKLNDQLLTKESDAADWNAFHVRNCVQKQLSTDSKNSSNSTSTPTPSNPMVALRKIADGLREADMLLSSISTEQTEEKDRLRAQKSSPLGSIAPASPLAFSASLPATPAKEATVQTSIMKAAEDSDAKDENDEDPEDAQDSESDDSAAEFALPIAPVKAVESAESILLEDPLCGISDPAGRLDPKGNAILGALVWLGPNNQKNQFWFTNKTKICSLGRYVATADIDVSKYTTEKTVSHHHAEVELSFNHSKQAEWTVENFSRNGTKVNSKSLAQQTGQISSSGLPSRVSVKSGDIISISKVQFKLFTYTDDNTEQT